MLAEAVVAEAGEIRRIVVAVDPPASSRKTSDACGIVAAGLDGEGKAVVLADATVKGAKPQAWARAAVALFHRLEADSIVAEVNQGGDMVTAVIRTVDPTVPVKAVQGEQGQMAARRAGGGALQPGPGETCRPLRRAGGRDVRLRPGRAVGRALARPGRRAGLGDRRADAEVGGGAEDSRLLRRQ